MPAAAMRRGSWGLAPRGATVEASSQPFDFALDTKDALWSDDVARLYAQAAAVQWDPATTIPWSAPLTHPDAVKDAVVQVMTYLIENETAALVIPARFAAQVHPHYREVMQLLAVQAADEARHIEVFTRRALLKRDALGLSTAGGMASLKTLVDEADFATASFLLSVLGEGTFLLLLSFLRERGPDLVTREVARWSGQDEARHVAFGMAHLARHIERDPTVRARLATAVTRRHGRVPADRPERQRRSSVDSAAPMDRPIEVTSPLPPPARRIEAGPEEWTDSGVPRASKPRRSVGGLPKLAAAAGSHLCLQAARQPLALGGVQEEPVPLAPDDAKRTHTMTTLTLTFNGSERRA